MAQAEAPRSSRRKQPSPRVSSTGLPASAPISLQQGEPQRKGRKRTAGAILAEEASALPQPAAAKRLRKPAGSYRELAGEGECAQPAEPFLMPSQPRSKFNPLNTEQPARVVQGARKELSKLQLHAAAAVNLKEAVSTQMVQ